MLSPGLSSHWVNFVTPVPRSLARPLVESLKNTAVASEHDIADYVPDPAEGLIGYDRAVELALTKIQSFDVPTTWSSAATQGAPSEPLPTDPDWAGGSLYVDERERDVQARPDRAVADHRRHRWSAAAGTRSRWAGGCAAGSTGSPVDPVSSAVVVTPTTCCPATRWTGGASRRSTRDELLRLRAEMRLPGSGLARAEHHRR